MNVIITKSHRLNHRLLTSMPPSLRQTYGAVDVSPPLNFYYNLQLPARYGSPRRSDLGSVILMALAPHMASAKPLRNVFFKNRQKSFLLDAMKV